MRDQTLEKLVADLTETVQGRYYGKYRGIAEDVQDDENLGRIIAKVPSVYGDANSPWALPAVPFAGQGHGFVVLPKKGDGVWIEFEGGNPSRPIWTGCWWARGEMPSPGGPEERVLVTPEGLKLVLDDAQKKLQLLHPGGAEITLTDKNITLKIGSTKIVLSAAGVNINNGALKVT
ncbi:MAG TPA: phage baseplate assembly protein V [Candidatus Methylomirabilis sp.]